MRQNTSLEKVTIIVGLGSTGLSCARYFSSIGKCFKVVDSRKNPPQLEIFKQEFPNIELRLGSFDDDAFLDATDLIVSPGVSLKTVAIAKAMAKGVKVSGDIDIFCKEVNRPIVAITGSNGKSTVVALLASMASNAKMNVGVGGNLDDELAMPALDLLRQQRKDLYVLELSSFQLERTEQVGAELAVILNLSADHMDRYQSMDDYHAAKQRIFRGCKQVLINRDDEYSNPTDNLNVQKWNFGLSRPDFNGFGLLEDDGDQYLAFQFEKIVSVSELKVLGKHNISNVLAALALGHALGIPRDIMIDTLKQFGGLPHRCQWVGNLHGIDFYDDSKGTNVGASVAAIEGLGDKISGHIILIAGGMGKGADFTLMRSAMNRWGRGVVLIGQDAQLIADSIGDELAIDFADTMVEAVNKALEFAHSGDAILLSPACASFDMFDNFQHRGRVFVQAVGGLQ